MDAINTAMAVNDVQNPALNNDLINPMTLTHNKKLLVPMVEPLNKIRYCKFQLFYD